MTRKSKVRGNKRSKRVKRNRDRSNRRNTKRLTKRGRRTNVRKNSKKVNSKRRKRRKTRKTRNTRKTRQNVIMKGGVWEGQTSVDLPQPDVQDPLYYDLFAGPGEDPEVNTPFVKQKEYPGRTGVTPRTSVRHDLFPIKGVGRLKKGTEVWYMDETDSFPAEILEHARDTGTGRYVVQLDLTKLDLHDIRLTPKEREEKKKWAFHSEIKTENQPFTTMNCGDKYLAEERPAQTVGGRPTERPLYLKVLEAGALEPIWIYFLSKYVQSGKLGSSRKMFLLRPVSEEMAARLGVNDVSTCHGWVSASVNEAGKLKDRPLRKYVDHKIKGIVFRSNGDNTFTVSYKTGNNPRTGAKKTVHHDVFTLLPTRNVKISDYKETEKAPSSVSSMSRLEGPDVFEEDKNQDWNAFERNLSQLWDDYKATWHSRETPHARGVKKGKTVAKAPEVASATALPMVKGTVPLVAEAVAVVKASVPHRSRGAPAPISPPPRAEPGPSDRSVKASAPPPDDY